MSNILKLADGTEIQIQSDSSLNSMNVIFPDKASMVKTWDSMTNENLKTVQITDENGTVVAEYTDLVLNSVTSTEQADGTILTSFKLRQKTEVELLKEQMAEQAENTKALEEQNAMLTECVLEMSEIVYGG